MHIDKELLRVYAVYLTTVGLKKKFIKSLDCQEILYMYDLGCIFL